MRKVLMIVLLCLFSLCFASAALAGLPKQSTLDKLTATNVQVYRTDLNGNVVVTIDGSTYSVTAQNSGTQINKPTVTTGEVTYLTSKAAAMIGTIEDTGGENCDQIKFQYRVQGTTEWSETAGNGPFGICGFGKEVYMLIPNTTYEFKAMAHNSAGWGEGEINTFKTLKYGDINGDGSIDILDIQLVHTQLGPNNNWDAWKADINHDYQVNIVDLLEVAGSLG